MFKTSVQYALLGALRYVNVVYVQCGFCPSDLEDLAERRVRDDLLEAYPFMVVVFALLKYGPAREALHAVWARRRRPKVNKPFVLYELIGGMIAYLRNVTMNPWTRHCGKGISRSHGWNVWIKAVGVAKLASNSEADSAGQHGHNNIGAGGQAHIINNYTLQMGNRLSRVMALGGVVEAIRAFPPRTVFDYARAVQCVQQAMVQQHLCHQMKVWSCSVKWLARAIIITEMRAQGIRQDCKRGRWKLAPQWHGGPKQHNGMTRMVGLIAWAAAIAAIL